MERAPIHHEIATSPHSGVGYWITADDGLKLRVGVWQPDRRSRGTVLIFPGRGDYIELFGHPVSALVNGGFTVLVIDWRGHGLSGRIAQNPKVGHINSFSDYQIDVDAMMVAADELELPEPRFLVAHSMGGCVALRSLLNGLDVEAVAFSAPMFGIHMAPYERLAARPLTWAMRALGKAHLYAPGFNDNSYVFRNDFSGNTLTNSSEEYERWIVQGKTVPALHTGGPSMGWLYAALVETRELSKKPSPDVPCIAFCGDQEVTVDVNAIKDRMNRWPKGTLEYVPNAKHELFLETPEVCEAVLSRTLAFFGQSADQ